MRWIGYVLKMEKTDTVRLIKGMYFEWKREGEKPKKKVLVIY